MGSLLGGNVQVILSLNPPSHVTEAHVLNSKTVLSNYGEKPRETAMALDCLGSLLELHEHLKGGCHVYNMKFLVRQPGTIWWRRTLTDKMAKFYNTI